MTWAEVNPDITAAVIQIRKRLEDLENYIALPHSSPDVEGCVVLEKIGNIIIAANDVYRMYRES